MPERTLTVRIVGDDRSLQQAFKRSEKAGKGFQVGVSGIGSAIGRSLLPAAAALLSVQTAFKIVGDSVDEASAINEEVAKSQQVFGDSSKAIVDWSNTTAAAMGISKRQALEATGIFGNLFSAIGIAPKESAELSRSLVELAADMASFNNASPEDVLLALRSGLVGEVEPLRKYGVQLSEARVQQVALAQTGKENVKSLTNQEKAQARYTIIMRDTVKAQGDVSRTSTSLANQQRQLAARTKDLEAALGTVLVPTLNILVGSLLDAFDAAGDLFNALEKIGDIPGINIVVTVTAKLAGGGRAQEILQDLVLSRVAPALLAVKLAKQLGAFGGAHLDVPQPVGTSRDQGFTAADATRQAEAQSREAVRAAKAATAAQKRTAKAFDEFVTGSGLKLDKARLTATTSDDLAALRELERAILRRIRAEGKTFKLVQLLTDTRLQISGIVEQNAQDAQQAMSDALNETIDSLDLKLEIAKSTRGFADDLRALRAIEAQILKQIAAEGRTAALLRRLFENRQEQAEALTAQRNAAQFEALGLTAEGEKPVAGRSALLRRARSLQDQVKGTILDTPKTNRTLNQIVAVLRNKTKAVGRDVRRAILDMLNDISSALEGGSTGQAGPMTKFAKRGVEGLVKGLGLTEDQVKEIRQRFSQFNRFDTSAGRRPPGRTTSTSDGPLGRPPGRDANVQVFVYIDGQKVEATVTRRQQKRNGRNAPQRRGVRPGK